MAARNYSGRHGSGAWLRWFKRRYRSTTLPVVQNQLMESFSPAVVIFQTERIIFIMITPPADNDNNGTKMLTAPTQQTQDLTGQLPHSLITSAKVDARIKAEAFVDQEIGKNGPETIFSEKQLKLNVGPLFSDFFNKLSPEERAFITLENMEILKSIFRKEYLATAEKKVQEHQADGSIYDDQMLAIREMVRQDKPDFKELHPPELLRYLATVRAIDVFDITADVTLDDLHEIREYVEEYRKQYNVYDLSKEVTDRSNGNSFQAKS